jgi:serine/threonine protein kinase
METRKLLDFGLAKFSVAGGAESKGDGDVTETGVSDPLTRSGALAGTVAYMSPEQARGEELDARTDLFSLGAVIFQMATGRVSFPGETAAVVFEGILNRQPPAVSAVNPAMPSELDDGSLAFHPVFTRGTPQPLGAMLPRDPFSEPVLTSADGRFVLVRRGSVPARIERLDLRTGRADQWEALAPREPRSIAHIWSTLFTPDGRGYAYTHGFYLQDLFLVDGLR